MANESYFISRDENEYSLPTEDAQIMSRYTTSTAADGTDEAKIYKLTGDIEAIIKNSLSPNEDADFYKTYMKDSMLSMQGLMGGGAYKHQCPFMSIAFANFIKKTHIAKAEIQPNKLFGKMDITSLVWCPAEAVSEAVMDCNLIAAKQERGKKFPSPVPLKSSMATLRNNTWSPFDPSQGQIPSNLLDQCFSFEVQQELQKQVTANKHLKPFVVNKRSDIGTIVLLCGIWFKTVEDLNKHIESVHGNVNLADFPKAHKVSSKPVNTSTATTLNEALRDNFNAEVVKIRGAHQCTLEQYVKEKNYERPTSNDSTDQVLDKMRTILTRVNNDFSVFDKEERVMVDQYGDIVTLFHCFFEDDPTWIRMFDLSAQAITENWNILGRNNTIRVSKDDILMWVRSMWEKRTARTFLRQIYLVRSAKSANYSEDMSVQLNTAVQVVREIFGSTVEMRLPVKTGTSDKWTTATVNISYFLIVQKLIEAWPHSDNKLWDLVKKLKLDQILVPRRETDEAAVLSTLEEGVQKLREKLRTSLPATNRYTGAKVNRVQDEESVNEIREEDLNDGYTSENFAIYQENVYKAWVEEFPESATKPTEQEFQILRRKNKIALERDAEKEACGRQRCQNRKGCFARRKKKQEDSKTLYITQHCIRKGKFGKNDKTDSKTEEVKCVKSGNHVDVTLKNQMLRLYEEDANETVTLAATDDGSGFRPATADESASNSIPTVSARLRGVGLIGNTTNELLLSILPTASTTNWLAVQQVAISTTSSVPQVDITNEGMDIATKSRTKRTRRSKRNRNPYSNSFTPEPAENISQAMDRFMDSLEEESVERIVDLRHNSYEKDEIAESEATDDFGEEDVIENVQGTEPTPPYENRNEPAPTVNNVLMVNVQSSRQLSDKTAKVKLNPRTLREKTHDKTLTIMNNRLYEEDAKNRRCSRSGCPLPNRCFHLREEKQLNHKILYNSWDCLDIYKRSIAIKLPHHKHLLTDQKKQLDEVDFRTFCKDSENNECSRPRCGDRASCFQKRSLERFISNQYYSNQLCYKKEDECEPAKSTVTESSGDNTKHEQSILHTSTATLNAWEQDTPQKSDEQLQTIDEVPAEAKNEDLTRKHWQNVQKLVQRQRAKTGLKAIEGSEDTSNENKTPYYNVEHTCKKIPQKRDDELPTSSRTKQKFSKEFTQLIEEIKNDLNIEHEDDPKNYEPQTSHFSFPMDGKSANPQSPNQTEYSPDQMKRTRRSKRNRNSYSNSFIPDPAENIGQAMDRFMDSLEEESVGRIVDLRQNSYEEDGIAESNATDLQSPNQTKNSQDEVSLSWADEMDEASPLTQYDPIAYLTPPAVNTSSKVKASQATRSEEGQSRRDRDTRNNPRGQVRKSVTTGERQGQQPSRSKANNIMEYEHKKILLKNQKRRGKRNKVPAKMLNQVDAGNFLRRTLSSSSDDGYSPKNQMEFLNTENESLIKTAEDYCRVFGYVTAASRLEKRPFPGDIRDKNLIGLMTQLSTEEYQRDAAKEQCSRPGCKQARKCFSARRSRSYTVQPDELYSLLECHQPIKKVKQKKMVKNNLTTKSTFNDVSNPKDRKKCNAF